MWLSPQFRGSRPPCKPCLVLRPKYSGRVPEVNIIMMMFWVLASPDHQQSWYWQWRVKGSMPSTTKNGNSPWWRHEMETFSALLAICAGNSPVPVNSPHKGQWGEALMFSLICVWINGWVNNREAGDLRRHRAHYDVIVMLRFSFSTNYRRTFRFPRHNTASVKLLEPNPIFQVVMESLCNFAWGCLSRNCYCITPRQLVVSRPCETHVKLRYVVVIILQNHHRTSYMSSIHPC